MREVVIVEAVRTPIGKRDGSLKDVRPDDLAGLTLKELVRRAAVDPALIEDVVLGCVTQVEEQGWNIARLATLIAGLRVNVPAITVNRMCGSGQQSVHFACQAILSGDMDVVVAGGIESMSRVKMGSDGKDFSKKLTDRFNLVWQGTSAEMMASKWNLSRKDIDEFALASHEKALAAINGGRFDGETFAVPNSNNGTATTFARDEGPRSDTSLEKLLGLKTAFKENGVITAGNSSQISDGAAAMLLMSADKAKELGL